MKTSVLVLAFLTYICALRSFLSCGLCRSLDLCRFQKQGIKAYIEAVMIITFVLMKFADA